MERTCCMKGCGNIESDYIGYQNEKTNKFICSKCAKKIYKKIVDKLCSNDEITMTYHNKKGEYKREIIK